MIIPLLTSIPDVAGESIRIHQFKGAISVDATVGGVSGRFLLGTAFSETYVNSDLFPKLTPDDSGTVEVRVGSVQLGRATPRPWKGRVSSPGIAGIIGSECLREFAVGLDVDIEELRLWPRNVGKADIEAWLRAGNPGAKLAETPIEFDSGGQPLVRARIGGRSGRFSIDATIVAPEVQPEAAPDTDSAFVSTAETTFTSTGEVRKVEVRVTNGFGLGDDATRWTPVRRGVTSVERFGGAEGLINPRTILSRRLVLDFPHKTLRYDVPTLDGAIGLTISRLTTFDVQVQGERLVFVPPLAPDADAVRRRLVGTELIEYEGRPAADMLAAMRAGGARRLDVLTVLLDATSKGFKGKILDGIKRLDLEIDPAG